MILHDSNHGEDGSDSEDHLIELLLAKEQQLREAESLDDPVADTAPENVSLPEEIAVLEECLRQLEKARRKEALLSAPLPSDGDGLTDELFTSSSNQPFGKVIGRFEIIRELGRGGLGVVLLAYDPVLHRQVALKIPRPEALFTPNLRERFRREARAAAALSHPNIVGVLETGEKPPILYIVSEYCAGGDLSQWLQSPTNQPSVIGVAITIAALANAVAHAHERGVLHRDLKPSNIMLEPTLYSDEEDSLRNFKPRITDFGLAKIVAEDIDATKSGTLLGTINYMSPEQAAGNLSQIGASTDIYSLGAILYEMLVGRPPFQGESPLDTVRRIQLDEPTKLHSLRSEIPRDLEAICLKCLEKSPANRYPTVRDLSDDLERFLRGEPVMARAPTPIEQAIKWSRRYPAWAALIAVSIIGFFTIITGIFLYQTRLEAALQDSRHHEANVHKTLEELEAKNRTLERRQYISDMRSAFEFHTKDSFGTIVPSIINRYASPLNGVDHQGFEWHYLKAETERHIAILRGHQGPVCSVNYSPDGKRLATSGHDKTVRIWDTTSWKEVFQWMAHDNFIQKAIFSPDGRYIATAGNDRLVKIWNASSYQLVTTMAGHTSDITSLVWAPKLGLLITGEVDGPIKGWTTTDWKEIWTIPGKAELFELDINQENTLLGSALHTSDESLVIYQLDTPSAIPSIKHIEKVSGIRTLAFHPDGRHYVRPSNRIELYDISINPIKLKWFSETESRDLSFRAMKYLKSGDYFVTAENSLVHLIRNEDGHLENTWRGATAPIWQMATYGGEFATASTDGTVRIWSLYRKPGPSKYIFDNPVSPHPFFDGMQSRYTLSTDGHHVSIVRPQGIFRIDVNTEECIFELEYASERTVAAQMSPLGNRAAVLDTPTPDVLRLRVFSMPSRQILCEKILESKNLQYFYVPHLTFSPDGSRIAMFNTLDQVVLIESQSGDTVDEIPIDEIRSRHRQGIPPSRAEDLAWSPDGSMIAGTVGENCFFVWSFVSKSFVIDRGHDEHETYRRVCFSNDGRLFAASSDEKCTIWRTDDFKSPIRSITAVGGGGLAFDSVSRVIALGSAEGDIRLFDVETGELFAELAAMMRRTRSHSQQISFTSDNRYLIGVGNNGAHTYASVWGPSPTRLPTK